MEPATKRIVTLGSIAFVIIFFVLIAITITSVKNRGTGVIQVTTAIPTDATATIDGAKIATNVEVRIKAGQHKLDVSRDGFTTKSQTITVKTGQDTATYTTYLSVANATGQKWLDDHPGLAIELEGAGSRAYEAAAEQTTLDNPIVEQLPLVDPQFRIDYGASAKYPNDNSKVGIYIQAIDPAGRQAALSLLRDKGFDPADLELIFVTPQV